MGSFSIKNKTRNTGPILSSNIGDDYDFSSKLITVGDAGVGKTSLILREAKGLFLGNTSNKDTETNPDFVLTYKFEKETIELNITDTCGGERYRTFGCRYYRNADIVFVCFDITDKKSFKSAQMWKKETDCYSNEPVCFLVGCKCDYLVPVIPPQLPKFPLEEGVEDVILPLPTPTLLPLMKKKHLPSSVNFHIYHADIWIHIQYHLNHSDFMKLRLTCKWLFNKHHSQMSHYFKPDTPKINCAVTSDEISELTGSEYEYFETSSKTGAGVRELFRRAAFRAIERNKLSVI